MKRFAATGFYPVRRDIFKEKDFLEATEKLQKNCEITENNEEDQNIEQTNDQPNLSTISVCLSVISNFFFWVDMTNLPLESKNCIDS